MRMMLSDGLCKTRHDHAYKGHFFFLGEPKVRKSSETGILDK